MNSANSAKNIALDKYIYILLAAIAVFYLINNFIWLKLNVYPYGPDEFSHLLIAQNFYNAIICGKTGYLVELFKLSANSIWPPLFHFTAAAVCFAAGASGISPLIINLFYLLILLFSVYSIGCRLYNKETGILAVLIISLYPMVFRYSRFFGLDFAQTSVLCLSIYFLMRTEYFSNRRFSVFFGISIGAGMLIKWSFALFLAGPLVCAILQALFLRAKRKIRLSAVSINLFLSVLVGALISLSWYLPGYPVLSVRLKMFFRTIAYHHGAQLSAHKISAVFGVDKFLGYLRLLVNEQISFFFFLVFILAALFFFRKRFNKLFLISWYLIPYMVLSLSFQKEGRFMLPALPAIALISAAGLQEMFANKPRNFLKHLFYATIISLGLMQFFDVSYNYDRRDKTFSFKTPAGLIHMLCYPTTEQHGWAIYGPPFKKDWKIDQIAASIVKDQRDKLQADFPILIGLLGEDDYVKQVFDFPKVLDYYLARLYPGPAFTVINFLPSPRQNDWSFIDKTDELNYVVFISGIKSWPEFNDFWLALNKFKSKAATLDKLRKDLYNIEKPYDFNYAAERLRKFLDSKERTFLLIDKIKLPDGYYAYVYKRKVI